MEELLDRLKKENYEVKRGKYIAVKSPIENETANLNQAQLSSKRILYIFFVALVSKWAG